MVNKNVRPLPLQNRAPGFVCSGKNYGSIFIGLFARMFFLLSHLRNYASPFLLLRYRTFFHFYDKEVMNMQNSL